MISSQKVKEFCDNNERVCFRVEDDPILWKLRRVHHGFWGA